MTYVADPMELRAPEPAPAISPRDLREYLDAIPANGWTPAEDLLLAEGLARGRGLAAVAAQLGTSGPDAYTRWKVLSRLFARMTWDHRRIVSIDGQAMLLAELRGRVC